MSVMSSDELPTKTIPVPETTLEHAVFRGLSPRTAQFPQACESSSGQIRKAIFGGLPLVMTGTLATGVIAAPGAITHPSSDVDHAGDQQLDARPGIAQRLHDAMLPAAHTLVAAARPDLPATYVVEPGDSPSSIANRFGIPTPAILTLNGLSWSTTLHPGQVLKLTPEPTKKRAQAPARLAPSGYVVQYGESPSRIADRLGISTRALLAANGLAADAAIYPGQYLRVPGASAATIERLNPGDIPRIMSAPAISPASLSAADPSLTDGVAQEADGAADPIFDAADLPLAEKPALITVKVPPKPAAPKAPAARAPQAPSPPAQPAAVAPPPSSVGQPVTGAITPLNDVRRENARIIVEVGRELGVPDYGIVIALATAMQESSLRNINWGDRDSLGLFQQRPSSGWGTPEQIMDPVYSTRLFYGGPSNPNRGRTRGLLDIAGWQNMSLTDAAQRVQISAHPQAYAKWEPSAWAWLYELS